MCLHAPVPDEQMAFADFSHEQQERICALLIPVCVFNSGTTDGELRRVFTALNQARCSRAEIIRSWTHVPIVHELFNVVDERLCPRIQFIAPRWRAQNHRMMHTWVKIAAIIWNDCLHLHTADRIEQWVANRTGPVPSADRVYFEQLIDHTVGILEGWHAMAWSPPL